MTDLVVQDAPHGTAAGYEQGCRCGWCRCAGGHIAADGAPEPHGSPDRPRAARSVPSR